MPTADYVVHIVDDEEPVRKSLAFMLTMNGFAVRVHESATAFLKFAPGTRNALLISDLRMPDIGGLELIRSLAAQKIRMPVIFITGHGGNAVIATFLFQAKRPVLYKPVGMDDLLAVLFKLLQEQEVAW